jgi:hypothetical protein
MIRINFRETARKGADWIHLAQDRDQWRDLVNTVVNIRVLLKEGNLLSS